MKINFYKYLNNRGFTLIELSLTIAIIIVLGIVSLPQFGGVLSGVYEEVTINKLIDDIQYTQNYALTNHVNTWFNIDIANNSYSYGFYNTPPNLDPQLVIDPATNQPSQIQLNSFPNIQLTNATTTNIVFNAFGIPSDSTSITINEVFNIDVSAGTGYVYKN